MNSEDIKELDEEVIGLENFESLEADEIDALLKLAEEGEKHE